MPLEMGLAKAIKEVLHTGAADIYYDSSFDTPDDIAALKTGNYNFPGIGWPGN